MKVNIIATSNFQREAKRLIKKYQSLKSELELLGNALMENPQMGTLIGKDTYKIRLAVKSKGKGKSGGMRVITYIEVRAFINKEKTDVYLLSIYDKSEFSNISDKLLKEIIAEIQSEIGEEE